MREADIQAGIIEELKKHGWLPVKLIQTNLNGINDVLALKAVRRTMFIEVKRPGEAPTDLQLYRHEQLRKMGFEVYVMDSKDDLKNIKEL